MRKKGSMIALFALVFSLAAIFLVMLTQRGLQEIERKSFQTVMNNSENVATTEKLLELNESVDSVKSLLTENTNRIGLEVEDRKTADNMLISNLQTGYYYSLPSWQMGYVDGIDGSYHINGITSSTIDYLVLNKGDTVTIKDTNIGVSYDIVMFNDDKTPQGAFTTLSTSGTTQFVADVKTAVKINFKYVDLRNFDGDPANAATNLEIKQKINGEADKAQTNSYWYNKKAVWFGTSIPTAGYPQIIGRDLEMAAMYNEAVGSSCVRAGSHAHVTADDPMGFSGMIWNVFLKSMSLSSVEKQEIFDNWDFWRAKLMVNQNNSAMPETISAEDQTMYKNCSWDIKLAKYLTGGSVGSVDLYIFDHGYNDSINYNWDDANELGLIPPSDPKDRTYFIGSMQFLFDKILSDNPKARILIIGHYENDRKAGIAESQEILATKTGRPIIKTWEYMGFSQTPVTHDGETKTITQWWMPDDLHPGSDLTGEAIQHYADVLTPHVNMVR